MKCSPRRDCNYFDDDAIMQVGEASMKCSPRRNCNYFDDDAIMQVGEASMKCSPRRNCNRWHQLPPVDVFAPQ